MTIERRFDIPLIASLARKEKQSQQNYRPIIAVHKWFARRPGTLFRGLLLSELADGPLHETYFNGHDFAGKVVADPFMGGGTPLIEANRIGCDVLGFDINPMAAWIAREEIEHLDHAAYRKTATKLVEGLEREVGELYRTDCPTFGNKDVPVKYFLWVKTIPCEACGHELDLFPGYLLADDTRHPLNVLVCAECGELSEVADLDYPGRCSCCRTKLATNGPAKRNRCACTACGKLTKYPRNGMGPLGHRLFAIEYANPQRRGEHQESDRLHRWGYRYYRELFNARQLLGLELSCRFIGAVKDKRIKHAIATNLSDLLRYQNMLCRYDTMALKSLDIFSVHGFPVGLVQCESNLLGIVNGVGGNVGSGGWTNIIDKYAKAKRYCDAPFEVDHHASSKLKVPVKGEWIGEKRPGAQSRNITIRCTSSTDVELAPASLDAVFTDTPYFGNVQYAELMDFCFAWLRKLVGSEAEGFDRLSTRNVNELTVNATEGRDLVHFTEGMTRVYSAMARALKPGAPLAFTYHHNKLEAYHSIGVAILDAGLTCSASLPCPAEMGGSIHIFGTDSSIVDTIFVCRSNGEANRQHLFNSMEELTGMVRDDLGQLRLAGVDPTVGDIRCIIFGHLTRMAIWLRRPTWDASASTAEKLEKFAATLSTLGSYQVVIDTLSSPAETRRAPSVHTLPLFYRDARDAVAF
jgi:putative DNA methylase